MRIDADVPRASVFFDRKYLGKTPVELRDVAPGPHRFNASAQGQEMYAETLEPLEVDYLKKNLRVKVRGGKTYNFTTKKGSADDRLRFQQKVEAARKRL